MYTGSGMERLGLGVWVVRYRAGLLGAFVSFVLVPMNFGVWGSVTGDSNRVAGVRYSLGLLEDCCFGCPLDFGVYRGRRYENHVWVIH